VTAPGKAVAAAKAAKGKKAPSPSSSDSESDSEPEKVPAGKAAAGSDSDSDSDSVSSGSSGAEDSDAPAAQSLAGKKHGRDGETQEPGVPVFVGLNKKMDEEGLRSFFKGYDIQSIETPASAFIVRFAKFENAKSVADLHGRETDGVHVNATLFPRQRTEGASAPGTPAGAGRGEASNTVFVGNLPFDADEDTIRSHFAGVGEVVSVRIATDRETGRPRGFGHVEFSSVEEAAKAVAELNGSDVNGREIRVDNSGGASFSIVGFRNANR
jgi:nucleolin